ncbi:MAG: hypothetical protein H6815_05155 [Phycisphaeraceae bacterium]|nr:hypothetical protein [Phycisphaerales bacterium]MCB9859824.1 hypothetical protein [Phycisphaeraceae bacterium]
MRSTAFHTITRTVSPRAVLLAAGFAVSALATGVSAQTTYTWTNLSGGLWNTAANWSPTGIPGAADTAILGDTATYTVSAAGGPSIGMLEMQNAMATLGVPAGSSLFVHMSTGPGVIVVNHDLMAPTTYLYLYGNNATIDSPVVLNADPGMGIPLDRARLATSTGSGQTLGTSAVVSGSGRIQGAIINNGLITATSGNAFDFVSANITQPTTGVIRAENGGTLAFGASSSIVGGIVEAHAGGTSTASGGQLMDLAIMGPGELGVQAGGTMFVSGFVDGDGTIVVNNDQQPATTYLYLQGNNATFDASVRLNANPGAGVPLDRARLASNSGSGQTLGENAEVFGSGRLQGAIINNGLVTATSGNAIEFVSANITQPTTGVIRAENGGTLTFGASSSIVGGIVEADAGGTSTSSGGQLMDLAIMGPGELGVQAGGSMLVSGLVDGDGTIVVNNDQQPATTYLYLQGNNATFDASVRLNANPGAGVPLDRARLASNSGSGQTLSENAKVFGSGRLQGVIINNGLITATSGNAIEFVSANITQPTTGVIRAENGGTLAFGASSSIVGGVVEADAGGTSTSSGGQLTDLAIMGPGELGVQAGGSMLVSGLVDGDGTIVVNNDQQSATTYLYLNLDNAMFDAHVRLNANPASGVPLDRARLAANAGTGHSLGKNSLLSGNGYLQGSIVHHGLISPGDGTGGIGEFQMTAAQTFSSEMNLDIELGGAATGEFDRLVGNGVLDLNGTLNVSYVNSYVPAGNERIKVIDNPTVNNEFATVNFAQRLSPTGPEHVVYNTNNVMVVMCFADCDGNGSLSIFDYICFGNAYASNDPYADCNLSGSLNIFDYICFGNKYAAGCP